MLDVDKWIASQSLMKELIAHVPHSEKWESVIKEKFRICTNIMEEYATVPAGEEFINTGIEIPKQFWNLPNNDAKIDWTTEWGRPQKVEGRGWYLFARGKDLQKVKQAFEKREDSFQDMVQKQETK